jgi:hypothetical protein
MKAARDLDDPFAPEADPYPPAAPRVSRRGVVRLALASPVVAVAIAGCAAPRNLVCAPTPQDAEHCTHRFCRYHLG